MELKQGGHGYKRGKSTLLIVPYGIETPDKRLSLSSASTFNRTLWN